MQNAKEIKSIIDLPLCWRCGKYFLLCSPVRTNLLTAITTTKNRRETHQGKKELLVSTRKTIHHNRTVPRTTHHVAPAVAAELCSYVVLFSFIINFACFQAFGWKKIASPASRYPLF
jgi:hypothetical protein